jgi:hypothetical protein
MRKVLLIAAAIVFVSGSASAVPPPIGYIGIFKDATHTITYSFCPAQYEQFHAWIWCVPGEHGLMAAEFAVGFPSTAVMQSQVKNPIIAVELGSLAAGISLAFGENQCQTDWVYLYDLTMILLSREYSWISILPHPGTLPVPACQFATCELGYPIEQCRCLTFLYLCPTWGVEESSWGAIKSLF